MTSQGDVNTMVSRLVAGRYNVVIVQVLGYMDNSVASHGAHWKSSIVPWSSRVTGSFDPLAYVCQQAHANGIQVHAWLGGSGGAMYRVSTAWPPAGNATLAAHPEWMMVPQANSEGNAVVAINGNYLLDMGSPDAQEYIVSIVRELVTNYQIDGINWDDEHGGTEYSAGLGFPAYSAATYTNSGLARYRRNTGYVGTPSATDSTYGNYRRRFKNELIARCQAEIQSIKTNPRQPLRHTSSTMAYGGPPGNCTFTSEEAYTYYSDWPTMLQNGWLDAAIPMNYKTSANDSMYTAWCDRAYSCWRYSRHIYMGLGAYLNPMDYTVTQLEYAYGVGLNGGVTYSYAVPTTDAGDWWAYVAANLYTNTATVPTMPWRNPATATEGIMWGRVKNAATGRYVDDATVTVASGPTVKTDGNGYYVATLISATAAGTVHSTTASKSGMTPQTIANAKVLAGDIVRYDFALNAPLPAVTLNTPTNNASFAYPATIALAATVTTNNNSIDYVSFYNGGTLLASDTNSPYTYSWTTAPLAASALWARVYYNGASMVGSATNYVTVTSPPPVIELAEPAHNSSFAAPTDLNLRATVVSNYNVINTVGFYDWGTNLIASVAAAPYSYTWSNVGAGSYSLTARATYNGSATAESAASAVSVTNNLMPGIVLQPQSCIRGPGGSASFQVTATNTTAYQWRLGGADLAGQTDAVLSLTNIAPGEFGTYTVLVSGYGNSVLSGPAQLVLAAQPTVTAPSLNLGAFSLTFSTEAGPTYTVEHKHELDTSPWQVLSNVPGTGAPAIVTDDTATNASGYYRIQVR